MDVWKLFSKNLKFILFYCSLLIGYYFDCFYFRAVLLIISINILYFLPNLASRRSWMTFFHFQIIFFEKMKLKIFLLFFIFHCYCLNWFGYNSWEFYRFCSNSVSVLLFFIFYCSHFGTILLIISSNIFSFRSNLVSKIDLIRFMM